uniref:Uncharacterized protein n=1 Tax=Avena sativa TaxID=4498 RepID=A0ACD5X4P4_AVESA
MDKERDNSGDFLDRVGPDISASIFRTFDHPADLLRASLVKRSWRRFVVENDFCRKLCERLFPEAAIFAAAVEVSRSAPLSPRSSPSPDSPESSGDVESRAAQAEFRIYSNLLRALVSTRRSVDCILHCIGASSTDNFPDETIENTLEPQDRINLRPSYSSGGQDEDGVTETLTYRLSSDICIVHEIRIQPFEAYFPRMVRFRMGHCKLPCESESFVTDEDKDEDENQEDIADENYVWTYTSPEFPVLQESSLQTFKLQRPVLCIGGVVKIELLGVQRQATDDRYYICVCHAQVVGRSLSPVLMVDISDSGSRLVLKYLPAARGMRGMRSKALMQDNTLEWLEWARRTRYNQTRRLATMNLLLGPVQINELDNIIGGGV